jgi:nicotinamidase-related amidase
MANRGANRHKSSGIWDASECALLLIDYQSHSMPGIRSNDPKAVEQNARCLAKAAVTLGMPVVLSTLGVKMGLGRPTVVALRNELPSVAEIDRTMVDAWEDRNFIKAVRKTGRKRLVMGGVHTEASLTYTVVAALEGDYDVGFVADAAGGLTKEAHEIAVLRMIQAGAVPHTTIALITEWFRDWKSPLATAARQFVVRTTPERPSHASIEPSWRSPSARPEVLMPWEHA